MRTHPLKTRLVKNGELSDNKTKVIHHAFISLLWLLILFGVGVGVVTIPAYGEIRHEKNLSQTIPTPWSPPSPAWRVAVNEDGLFQLTYTDLQAAGLPVDTLDPRTLRMYYQGQEIPILVIGEADGQFNASDTLLFYGRSVDSLYYDGLIATNKYTNDNIYWLTYGGTNGWRIPAKGNLPSAPNASTFSHTVRLEQNVWYQSAYPFREGADHWYGDLIRAVGENQTGSRQYDFQTAHLPSGNYSATITATFLGFYSGAHHLQIFINNTRILDDPGPWSDNEIYTATMTFSQSLLNEGINTITLALINDTGKSYDQAYVNWIQITYADDFTAENDRLTFRASTAGPQTFQIGGFQTNDIAVYDVTDFMSPKEIEGGSITGPGPYTITVGDNAIIGSKYIALTPAARLTPASITRVTPKTSAYTPADLLQATNGADYILITHADFWDDALRLAQYRSNDFRVALIDVQTIYDQFNGGMMSAEAIRDFLAYAYHQWTLPAPQYVTLLGDGSYDMRGYGNTHPTFIPPYLALVDPTLGETASDNHFVSIDGLDPVPDIGIGRLPANTPQEAQAMVDKIIDYETVCSCGQWNYQTIFYADNLEGGGGNFYEFSDRIADGYDDPPTNTVKYVPEAYTINKFYLGQTCDVTNPTLASECPAQLAASLNMTGALFVSYVGHATTTYWAREHLWDQNDVYALTNGPCLPLMLGMTCFEGYFQDPTQDALGEYQVRFPIHGAIASWSSTGFGLATGHDVLEKGLMLAFFYQGHARLGQATSYAKQYLWEQTGSQYLDLIETYTLLGDAALALKTNTICQAKPTAVTFTQLQAVGVQGAVRLSWQTADEYNVVRFDIFRRPLSAEEDFQHIPSLTILARGAPSAYWRFDKTVEPGARYAYRLRITHSDGHTSWRSLGIASPTFGHIFRK